MRGLSTEIWPWKRESSARPFYQGSQSCYFWPKLGLFYSQLQVKMLRFELICFETKSFRFHECNFTSLMALMPLHEFLVHQQQEHQDMFQDVIPFDCSCSRRNYSFTPEDQANQRNYHVEENDEDNGMDTVHAVGSAHDFDDYLPATSSDFDSHATIQEDAF